MTENQILEDQTLYEQEEEINLVSLLFTVLHKYRQMAAAALVCAVLFAGVAVAKNISWNAAVQKAAEEGETAPRTSAQQTYEEDMVEYREAQNKRDTDVQSYNQQLRDNERSQQTVQFNIDNAEEYMEKSVLNSIDPYNVYNARADLYVTTDYKIMPGMDYQNPDYTSSVLSAYTSLLTNHEAISAIAEQFNMEERYMRELVSVWGDNSTRLLSISINAASEEDATAILDAVIARMNGLYETIESTVGHHSITLLSRTSSVTVSTDLRDQQQNTRDNLTSLQNQMTDLQAQHDLLEQNIQKADQDLAALEEPEDPGRRQLLSCEVCRDRLRPRRDPGSRRCGRQVLDRRPRLLCEGPQVHLQSARPRYAGRCRCPEGSQAGRQTQQAGGPPRWQPRRRDGAPDRRHHCQPCPQG